MLLEIIGAGMIGTAIAGLRKVPETMMKRTLTSVIRQCDIGMERDDGTMNFARIVKMVKKRYGYRITIELPTGYAASKFEKYKEVLEQATGSQIRFKRSSGRLVYLDVGTVELRPEMAYSDRIWRQKMIMERAPIVPLFTPFGLHELNFWDDSCCHMLIGGATRMGKTGLQRLIVTTIIDRLAGQVEFVLINNKVEDLAPFRDIPKIRCAETIGEAFAELQRVKKEVQRRRQKLKQTHCTTIREYRTLYPGDPVPPLFVNVDEFGRFAEEKDIQDLIIELAETAGSSDVHLIIASQRPDAVTVLKPRIKANLLARIAFTTTDEGNSSIIIGSPDAAHLGGIKGRACLLDGLLTTIQVPYLSEARAYKMLRRFRVEAIDEPDAPPIAAPASVPTPSTNTLPHFIDPEDIFEEGGDIDVNRTGSIDPEIPPWFPCHEERPDREDRFPGRD